MKFDLPSGDLVEADDKGKFYGTREFMAFLKLVKDCCLQPRPQSGTTANRPIRYLEVGLMYYDTTLGFPVFVHTVGSPAVWHNAAGAVV